MSLALLVSTDPRWGEASGLGAALGKLGFYAVPGWRADALCSIRLVLVDCSSGAAPKAFQCSDSRLSCPCFAVVPVQLTEGMTDANGVPFDEVVPIPGAADEIVAALVRYGYAVFSAEDGQKIPSQLNELACGDRSVAQDIARLLIATNSESVVQLQGALGREAPDELRAVAHRLNGSLKMLRCSMLVALATLVEQAAREQNFAFVQSLLYLVADGMDGLNTALGQWSDASASGS
ncbi:Hpt domain-containing protein [Paraburkholderia hayleyella]|uniref:Hpt domain-containing protein n=1 Tax=Paraburkholderia hayleyella TaxID=2152889 RepID=UPI00129166E7|nr:Hpt domain-containing protein [Paraburkholderia hayleyella]